MAIESSVVSSIQAVVDNEPENHALRVHLAGLLLDAGDPIRALNHCAIVLANTPDNLEALNLAAQAAQEMGDNSKAEGYRRLHAALSTAITTETKDCESESSEVDAFAKSEETSSESIDTTVKGGTLVRMRLVRGTPGDDEFVDTQTPAITLNDVAGMDEVKRRLNLAFLAPMKNPDLMKMYAKSMRGGLLLYGPPGCGKTFIGRAVAGELGAKFISVGLNDVLDMWIGNSERNLHEIFETARRSSPCVLFFDEIDALGRRRSLVRYSYVSSVIAQLLAEMDNVQNNNKSVFVLAATNHPWDVDPALRRPGRLDRTLLVLPPDLVARESILRFHTRERPLKDVDLGWLAGQTDEFSGADLAHLVDSAAEFAMEESLISGKPLPITFDQFKKALKDVRASTRPWFETARNYAMFSNDGGVYDELLNYLRIRRLV